jgi:hypothetical protein
MPGRRFLLLVAVLMGLTALAASLAPRDPALRGDSERRGATATPTATAAPQAAEPALEPGTAITADPVRRTISADTARPRRVTVTEGAVLELSVTGSGPASVRVLGRIDALAAESPARFHLYPRAGEYPIVLVEDDRRIGTLVVRSA